MLLVRNFLRYVVSFYPENLRSIAEPEIPAMSVAAGRLAFEVIDAELQGRSYIEVVIDPSFPLMGRVHFGMTDTLLWRIPEEFIEGVRALLAHAAAGDFDPVRQLMFAIATRRHDPEAALCRFFIWEAIRLNLVVATWDDPRLEASGLLHHVDAEAERILRDFLTVPDMLDEDIRPLNVLVQAAAEYLDRSTAKFHTLLGRHSAALQQLFSREEVLRIARRLDARSSAVLWPGEFYGDPGSQRVADRYPHHFSSANAVEAQRSRTVRRVRESGIPEPPGDRLIDLLRNYTMEAG